MSDDTRSEEFEDESALPLFPGIIAAVRDDRLEDALALADDLIEKRGDISAVISMATFADFLHRSPQVPVEQVAMMMSAQAAGMELTVDQSDGELVAELLSVIEDLTISDDFSPMSQEILSRWGTRQSSTALLALLCRSVAILLSDMKLQMAAPIAARRSPDAAEKFALADARSVLVTGKALNVFESGWDDGGAD